MKWFEEDDGQFRPRIGDVVHPVDYEFPKAPIGDDPAHFRRRSRSRPAHPYRSPSASCSGKIPQKSSDPAPARRRRDRAKRGSMTS